MDRVYKRYPLRAHIAANYLVEMRRAFSGAAELLKRDGYLILVAGTNRICGSHFSTKEYLAEILEEVGFTRKLELIDTIRSRGLMTKRNRTASVMRVNLFFCFKSDIDVKPRDILLSKIEKLSRKVWEGRASEPTLGAWLGNFTGRIASKEAEQLHALYLLSQFMYFGSRQMRELVRALYRDLFRYPIIESVRRCNKDTTNVAFIQRQFEKRLEKTRFLGVGNPSESGCHLLYYYRQMNALPRELFIHGHQIFRGRRTSRKVRLNLPDVEHYVFIDDFCGSGETGEECATTLVADLKNLNSAVRVEYHSIFGCKHGLERVRKRKIFDSVEAVVELDETFKCFGKKSRYFISVPGGVSKRDAKRLCDTYGKAVAPDAALGFDDCQLLLAFHHNTPDNTLPIFWAGESESPTWHPIFPRYQKLYFAWNP